MRQEKLWKHYTNKSVLDPKPEMVDLAVKGEKTLSKVELAQQEAYANFARELAEKIGVNARLNYSVHSTYTKSPSKFGGQP